MGEIHIFCPIPLKGYKNKCRRLGKEHQNGILEGEKVSIESKAGVEKTCQLQECGLEKVKEIYNGEMMKQRKFAEIETEGKRFHESHNEREMSIVHLGEDDTCSGKQLIAADKTLRAVIALTSNPETPPFQWELGSESSRITRSGKKTTQTIRIGQKR
jgi:hypothetical protein